MRVLAVLLVSWPLVAQTVSLGLRAGIPITPMLTADGCRQASGSRYTTGPLIEVHLWHGAGLGADFLVRHDEIWRWEAPITFVYRFGAPARPFVRLGVSVNRVFRDDIPRAELRHRGTSGPVAGGGLRFRFKKVWLEPEARVTRWRDRNFGVRDAAVRSNLNQMEILAGVVF